MKHTLLAFSLLTLCTTLLPMDKENITQPLPLQQTVMNATQQYQLLCTIDEAINKKCWSQNYFSDIINIFASHFISEEDMFAIVGLIAQYCGENPDNTLLDNLYAKNNFFSKTIDHFTTLAQHNLKTLSADNLKIIENPRRTQPTPQLNKLTVPLKKYIMQRALKTNAYAYDIKLTGHKEDIAAFDICEATDQAVTASMCSSHNPDNNSLYLWNLKTGKFERLDEKRPVHLLAFSSDGNYIAAALFDIKAIHIWCPKTKKILMTIDTHYGIESIQYTQPINHTLVTMHTPTMTTWIIQQWALASHTIKAGESVGYNTLLPSKHPSIFRGDTYYANHTQAPIEFKAPKTLYVTKKSIPLYLCTQAIKNSQNNKLLQNTIEQSSSYQALTDLEKPMVLDEIRKKTAALKAMPQRAITLPLLHLNN